MSKSQQLTLWPVEGERKKPVMGSGHDFQTVQGIMIDRLDSMVDDICRIVADEVGQSIEVEPAVLSRVAGRVVDAINYRFFPEAYEDGEPYTPDPAGRMDSVPVNPVGLIPRLPTLSILAAHLERGRKSPAAKLSMPDGSRVFSDRDLNLLGQRIEMREGRSAAI